MPAARFGLSAVMCFYDTFISPPFYFKPIIKMLFFLVIPTILLMWTKTGTFKGMFRLSKKNFAMSLLGGLAVFVFILAAFFIFRNVFDFSKVAVTLEESIGVSRRNLLFVGIYISLVNSLLEEYFFRGVAFLTLKRKQIVSLPTLPARLCLRCTMSRLSADGSICRCIYC